MGHILDLELQSSGSGYQLKVVATFDGGGFAHGGQTCHGWNGETQEWTVDVIAASASPGVDQVTYFVFISTTNPIPNASQAIVVRLVDGNGNPLPATTVDGGGTILLGGSTNDGTRPFEDPKFIKK